LDRQALPDALQALVNTETIHKATVWETACLKQLGIAEAKKSITWSLSPALAAPQT